MDNSLRNVIICSTFNALMLTFTGEFLYETMVDRAMPYVQLHINKNNPDEAQVPYKNAETGEIGYIQFALLAGNWVYVSTRMEGE